LSGGGLRSSNFSAACMFELQKMGILDHVDCISSVSGGSLPAAYYCVGQRWDPQTLQERLTHPFANDVLFTMLQPWNMFALWVSSWDRSDVLADSFQRNLYSRDGRGLTFADLRGDRPRLLINCTDLQSGKKFVFSDEEFDTINSDLNKYPIAWAVAASSAVPVVLHQVTLRDYSTIFEQYRHLIDGGIYDNLGVTSLVETYAAQIESARQQGKADPYPRGMILLVIDAHTEASSELESKPDVGLLESLSAGAGLSTTVLLNRISSATMSDLILKYSAPGTTAQTLLDQIKQLNDTGLLDTKDRLGKRVRVVYITLAKVGELSESPFFGFGYRINSIAAYFNIDTKEAYDLYKAAALLLNGKVQDRLGEIARDLNSAQGASTQPTGASSGR
ncbi:MAG TPA: patatin-like phospholipase family protein, partial [Tepidisphaeraceae bacterium]